MRFQRITTRGEPIDLGYKNEDDATQIAFDIPDDWQDGIVTLYVLRMGDSDSYVPSGFYVEDGVAYWNVSSVDTEYEGRGLATYCAVVNGKIIKSRAFTTITKPSAVTFAVDVPEPQKSVLDSAIDMTSTFAARAEQSANEAQETAQEVSEAVTTAEGYAQRAESAQTIAEAAKESAEGAAQAADGHASDAGESATAAARSATNAANAANAANTALNQAQSAQGGAEAAQRAAEDAETDAVTAQGKAESAQQAAERAATIAKSSIYEWFSLSVDEETGHLIVTERSRNG